jgi:hypothetical protein
MFPYILSPCLKHRGCLEKWLQVQTRTLWHACLQYLVLQKHNSNYQHQNEQQWTKIHQHYLSIYLSICLICLYLSTIYLHWYKQIQIHEFMFFYFLFIYFWYWSLNSGLTLAWQAWSTQPVQVVILQKIGKYRQRIESLSGLICKSHK